MIISRPSDYDFIDWNSGDMPTGFIDGGIMPLRAAARKNDLRGVDIAFLAEYLAESMHAFEGATYSNASGSTISWRDVNRPGTVYPMELTRILSAYQMQSYIWDRLSTALGYGTPYNNIGSSTRRKYGFWTAGTTVNQRFVTARSSSMSLSEFADAIDGMATRGCYATPSTARADFNSGHGVVMSDIASLFEDCKKLAYPVVYANPYTSATGLVSMFSRDELTYESTGPRDEPYHTANTPFRVQAYWYSDTRNYSQILDLPNVTRDIIRVPMKRLGSVHVYLLYSHAYMQWSGGSSSTVHDDGIMDLEPYLTQTVDSDNIKHYGVTPSLMRSLAYAMLNRKAPTPTTTNEYETLDGAPVLLGTLSDRLKWW